MLLYHYFDKKTGPFRNLSDLSEEEAKKLLLTIKAEKPETMCAKRQDSYIADRRRFEEILRTEFQKKGGKIEREAPHYLVIKKYGLPQDWNPDGEYGPERYVEAHVWSDRGIKKMAKDKMKALIINCSPVRTGATAEIATLVSEQLSDRYIVKNIEKEVDFVAIKEGEKVYIQVSDDISREDTFKREVSSLLGIKDAYPKLLIARTKHDESQHEGIRIIDIARWLSDSQK